MAFNTVTVTSARKQLELSFRTGHTTVLEGEPGGGKTHVARQIARDYLRHVFHVDPESNFFYYNCATKTLEWAGGIMMPDGDGGCNQMVPGWFKNIPDYSIIVMDEADKLSQRDQLPFLQIAHERSIDNVSLGKNVHIIMCVNRVTDGGSSSGLNNLLGNRVRRFVFKPSAVEALAFFGQSGMDPRLYTYLQQNPNKINCYDPKTPDGRNATSRSWMQASDALKALGDGASVSDFMLTVSGSIPDHLTQECQLYCELGELLTPTHEIFRDPKNAKLPPKDNPGLMYLQVNAIATKAASMKSGDKYTFDELPVKNRPAPMTRGQCKEAVYWYAKRMPSEYLNAVVPLILMPAVDGQQKGGPSVPAGLGGEACAELLKMYADKKAILNDEPVTEA